MMTFRKMTKMKCDKANCKIDEASGDEILWVQCGKRY